MKSLMFVPSKPKMLAKISLSEADACIIDLEDSIPEDAKEQALADAIQFLKNGTDKKIYVRVNRERIYSEIDSLKNTPINGYMIPKFEKPEDYENLTDFFVGKEIIALVETPMGIVNLCNITSCSFVTSVAFGAEDFTSFIGMKNCAEYLNFARSSIVTYGKAFGKLVYDTPSFVIDNEDELEQEIQVAVDMGFDGKLAIHPKQIDKINKLFQYFDVDYIKNVIEQYENSGEAVLKIDGHVYEKMHIAHFKRILREHGIK